MIGDCDRLVYCVYVCVYIYLNVYDNEKITSHNKQKL